MATDYNLLGGFKYKLDPNQLQQESLTLQQMAQGNRAREQEFNAAQAAADEKARQSQMIQGAAQKNLSPMEMIAQGVNPEYMKEYSDLYNKNLDWSEKNKESLKKDAEDNLKKMAADAFDLDPNDPNSAQQWLDRQKIRGADIRGYNVTPQFLRALKGLATTPKEKIEQEQFAKQQEQDIFGNQTNRINAETQRGNLELQKKEFEFKKNQPIKEPQTPSTGKPMSAEAATKIGLIASGIQGAQTFLDQLQKGDPTFWATTPFGGFTNPDAAIAFDKATESLGRLNSGGAINKDEEKRFARLVANKKALMTEKGREAVIKELSNFVNRSKSTGDLIFGGSDWQQKFNIAQPPQQAQQTQQQIQKIKNDADYDKLKSGDFFIDPYGNKRRKP